MNSNIYSDYSRLTGAISPDTAAIRNDAVQAPEFASQTPSFDTSFSQTPSFVSQYAPQASVQYAQATPDYTAFHTPTPKRRFGRGRLVAFALSCLLLGGALGLAGHSIFGANRDGNNTPTPTQYAIAGEPAAATPVVEPPTAKSSSTIVYDAQTIYANSVDACVGISSKVTYDGWYGQEEGDVTGSGFIVSKEGYIVTNSHVINSAYEQNRDVTVSLHNGKEYVGKIVGSDPSNDIALIKIEPDGATLKTLPLGSLDNMRVGDNTYAIGNPLGYLTFSFTEGILSAFDRKITTEEMTDVEINMFQITTPLNSGNSGGPIFNDRGEVVGIASAKPNSSTVEGIYFAIPYDDVREQINQWITQGYRPRPVLGVTVIPINGTDKATGKSVKGAGITDITVGGAADKAGLKIGDVITKVDDYNITNNSTLITVLRKNYSAGDTAKFTVYRSSNGKAETLTFDVTFAAPTDTPVAPSPSSGLPDFFNQ